MEGADLLRDQVVVVRDGTIVEVRDRAARAVPDDASVIATPTGATLIPGFTDFHVHTLDRDEFWLFLANGVTTVRNLHGLGRHLGWRDSLERGLLDGPRLLSSGPILDGSPPSRATNEVVTTLAEARAAVDRHADLGFDYIKLYDNVAPDVYAAIVSAAHGRGLRVSGHWPTPVGLTRLPLDDQQDIVEHLEELLPFFNDGRTTAGLDSLAAEMARRGMAVVPTMSVFTSALAQSESLRSSAALPEAVYVKPATRAQWGWDATAAGRFGQQAAIARFARTTAFMRDALLPALQRAGVRIVAGTDAPIPMVVPGFALDGELREYARAGLSPRAVLATATVNAAALLPVRLSTLTGFGTITVGAPADLQLLGGNPLADLGQLRNRLGVVARGIWYDRAWLQGKLDSLAASYHR